MKRYTDTPFRGELDIIKTLSGRAIQASLNEQKSREALTSALRAALRAGVSIDELSAESGLTTQEIRARLARNFVIHDDSGALSGIVS